MSGHVKPDVVLAAVTKVLGQACSCRASDINVEQRLRDLGIDSVGSLGICVVLDAETGVSLDPERLIDLLAQGKVSDLVSLLVERATQDAGH